jgi:hypothetical protein
MILNDKIDFFGKFSFKAFHADGSVEEYEEKNLIMDKARNNMAQLIGGITSASTNQGRPIDTFVLGTQGHVTNILTPKQVGSDGFDSTLSKLFSETANSTFYKLSFDPYGADDITIPVSGILTEAGTTGSIQTGNTVRRVVSERTVTYTITIESQNANSSSIGVPLAFTEAALYCGDDIFSMKTFPARVKENTVKFEIVWSIIF